MFKLAKYSIKPVGLYKLDEISNNKIKNYDVSDLVKFNHLEYNN